MIVAVTRLNLNVGEKSNNLKTDILTITEDAEAEQSDVVLRALHMAQIFASKADELLANLTQLDAITLQIKLLQNSVDEINATISASENKVALIKNDLKKLLPERWINWRIV